MVFGEPGSRFLLSDDVGDVAARSLLGCYTRDAVGVVQHDNCFRTFEHRRPGALETANVRRGLVGRFWFGKNLLLASSRQRRRVDLDGHVERIRYCRVWCRAAVRHRCNTGDGGRGIDAKQKERRCQLYTTSFSANSIFQSIMSEEIVHRLARIPIDAPRTTTLAGIGIEQVYGLTTHTLAEHPVTKERYICAGNPFVESATFDGCAPISAVGHYVCSRSEAMQLRPLKYDPAERPTEPLTARCAYSTSQSRNGVH